MELRKIFEEGITGMILAIAGMCAMNLTGSPLYYVGRGDGDLSGLIRDNGLAMRRFATLDAAMRELPDSVGLIIAADGYPEVRTEVSERVYAELRRRGVRLFVEYPAWLPSTRMADTAHDCRLERAVVCSDMFGDGLRPMSILGVNGCRIIPTDFEAERTVLAMAKVAGFDVAQFGLTDTKVYPLVITDGDDRLVALSKLSDFKRGRFGPARSWQAFWQELLRWLSRDSALRISNFATDPTPTYGPAQAIGETERRESVRRGADWIWKANLLIHPSWEESEIPKYQSMYGNCNLFFGPAITDRMAKGDGSRGVMEGHGSTVFADGSQLYRYFTRADVQGETAMLLASAGKMTGEEKYDRLAERLLDYLFYDSGFRGGPRGDRRSSAYGLLSWANTHPETFYNDDNARCILGAIGASAMTGNRKWTDFIVENILANYRTSSRQGFQGGMLKQEDIEANGWRYYSQRDLVNPHPHFESWMLACYLWLYDKTGYQPLLDKARRAIGLIMEAYPDGWHCQNGIQQERARMILPLAWLVRVDDTAEHRQWLATVVDRLLQCQDPCGAIREELGRNDQDLNKILVTSNDAYGKNEAPLIARNGELAADMLYTCNFAFFALNEAAHATGDARYRDAVRRLADFLVRIQVKSEGHKDIDGAWFRAFDFGRWDYWASNADNGWGAWCTLTGWIQSWIVTTESLVATDRSYWDLTRQMEVAPSFDRARWMLD